MSNLSQSVESRNSNTPSKEFLLTTLRVEHLRARAGLGDIEALGIALKGELISAAQAAEHMHDLGIMPPIGVQIEENAA
jgi:hypothetical protein